MKEATMVRKGREWVPNVKVVRALFEKRPEQNVIVALHKGRKLLDFVFGENIVTTAGDIYYAQKACGESPTVEYADMYLGSAGPATPAKNDNRADFTDIGDTNKAKSANYPRTADPDTDNTGNGANVASWLFSYAAGDGNWTGITHAYITKNTPAANESLLSSIKFGANWAKDSNTSAKIFVNHAENGV